MIFILRRLFFFLTGLPLGLGLPLGFGFFFGGGAFAGGRGAFAGGGGAFAGGGGAFAGGGGAFAGGGFSGGGGFLGGALGGLCGGFGGGGGTLSAMAIFYWQSGSLFQRIGGVISFLQNYAGYLIKDLQGIGCNFSLAFNPSSSITNKLEITSPPNFSHNLTQASTVPPVARRSSIMIIF